MTRIILKSILLSLVLLLGTARSALACSVCNCGDPLQSVSDIAPTKESFRLGWEAEILSMNAGSEETPGRTEYLTQATLNTVLGYSPSKDLVLSLFVPLVGKEFRSEGGGDPAESSSQLGTGDLSLAVRWYFLQAEDFSSMQRTALAFTLGSLVPTGPNDLREGGLRIDEHEQLGRGAWGPFAGLYATHGAGEWEVSGSLTAQVLAENGYGYRYGTALRWGSQLRFKPDEDFALSLALDGRGVDADLEDDSAVENTGGTVLVAVPGLWFSPAESMGVYAKVQLPFFTRLLGEQTVGVTAQLGTQFILD